MPIEWNYGYCEGNKEARVTFLNSGSTDVQTVISKSPPVRWETQIIAGSSTDPFSGKGQCCDGNYFVYLDRSTDGGVNWTANAGGRLSFKGKFLGLMLTQPTPTSNRWVYQFESCAKVITTTAFASGGTSYYLRVNRIERWDGKPDNCGGTNENQCKFTVSDNSGIIYNQTTAQCPTNVTASCGKKCPPNTCECRHGRKVCCYGADGIVVTSFDA